ncbi:hypothetical protein QYM36_007352, partial [Artemia franciscana]
VCDKKARMNDTEPLLELQEQIYVISGVLGGVSLILLVLVIVLFSKISSLRKVVNSLRATSQPYTGATAPTRSETSKQAAMPPQDPEVSQRFSQYPPNYPMNGMPMDGKPSYQENPGFVGDNRFNGSSVVNKPSIDPRYLQYRSTSNVANPQNYPRSNASVTYSKY